MSRVDINVSGACGSGTSITIYETPEYKYPWHGVRVTHGSLTLGPESPDDQRIEIITLCLPGLNIRVCANDVRTELRALLAANKAWQVADWSAALQPARHQAFVALQRVVFSLAARGITVEHLEQIAQGAYTDGLRDGEESMRGQFRELLGL
jgi:hypothetical protein